MTTVESYIAHVRRKKRRMIVAWFCDYFLFGLFYRQILKILQYRQWIARVGEWGLRPADNADPYGPFVGKVRGYGMNVRIGWKWGLEVHAVPDSIETERNRTTTEVSFKPRLRLHLRQDKADGIEHEQSRVVETKDLAFNELFKDRRADVETARILAASYDLQVQFVGFHDKWMERLSNFEVNDSRFECTLHHVGIFYTRVTEEEVLNLLNDLAELLMHFDQSMKKREFIHIKICV